MIELIIAITILAFLSIYSARSIQSALRSKTKIQNQNEDRSVIRDALKLIEKDVNRAFNYQNYHLALYNEVQKKRCTPPNQTQSPGNPGTAAPGSTVDQTTDPSDTTATTPSPTPAPWQAPPSCQNFKVVQPKIVTRFLGETDEMHFTTLNYARLLPNQQASQQAEVSYFVRDCKGRLDKKKVSKCLWRRLTPYIQGDIKEGGDETVLLEDVKKFELRYLGYGAESEPVKEWDSKSDRNPGGRFFFPYAVQVTLAIATTAKNDEDRAVEYTLTAPIRFPNNPVAVPTPTPGAPANATGSPATGTGSQ